MAWGDNAESRECREQHSATPDLICYIGANKSRESEKSSLSMTNYVISLSSAQERRTHIQQEFQRHQLDFEFYDAITPQLNEEKIQTLGLTFQQTNLTAGEISCLLSHLSLWQKAIDEQMDYISIFEDDIYLGRNAEDLLSDYVWIPADAHIIKLEVFAPKIKMAYQKYVQVPDQRGLYQLNGMHLGCAGYILSRSACQELLQYARGLQDMIAVDHIVFDVFEQSTSYRPYQLSPGICIQSDILKPRQKDIFNSSLEQARRQRFDVKVAYIKQRLGLQQKIVRECLRVVNQVISFYQHRSIRFK